MERILTATHSSTAKGTATQATRHRFDNGKRGTGYAN